MSTVRKDGPTPLGGARTVSYWFAADGSDAAPADAVRGEIVEFGPEGDELGRTYVERRPDQEGDAVALNGPGNGGLLLGGNMPEDGNDGPKRTWDIMAPGWRHPARTRRELLEALGWERLPLRDQFRELSNLLGLPAWTPAPAELKAEVYAWLEANRQE